MKGFKTFVDGCVVGSLVGLIVGVWDGFNEGLALFKLKYNLNCTILL